MCRCMDCGTPFCQTHTGCPVNNLIPEFNELFIEVTLIKNEGYGLNPAVNSAATPENERVLKLIQAGDAYVKSRMKERAVALWEQLLYEGSGVEDEGHAEQEVENDGRCAPGGALRVLF